MSGSADDQVREFLRRLRAPAPEVMRAVFTRGGCYALHEILASVWKDTVAYQTCRPDGKLTGAHVVTHIPFVGFYDITGKRTASPPVSGVKADVEICGRPYRRMTPAECRKARKWKCGWSSMIGVPK